MIEMTDEEFYHYWCRFGALHASAGIGDYTPSEEELKDRLIRERKIRIVPSKTLDLDANRYSDRFYGDWYPKRIQYKPRYDFDPNLDWEPEATDVNLGKFLFGIIAGIALVLLIIGGLT